MRHEVFADAVGALDELGESHSMALLTNGAACLQREKLAASGLGDYFDAVVVSADVGVAKPGAAAFEHALAQLGASSGRAVMVGDSLAKDIEGAHAVGLRGVWVNRDGRPAPDGRPGHPTITTLSELSSVLGELYEYSPLQPQDPSLPCETASEKPDGGLTTDSIAPSAKGTGKATEPGRSRDSGSGRQRAKGRSPGKEKMWFSWAVHRSCHPSMDTGVGARDNDDWRWYRDRVGGSRYVANPFVAIEPYRQWNRTYLCRSRRRSLALLGAQRPGTAWLWEYGHHR